MESIRRPRSHVPSPPERVVSRTAALWIGLLLAACQTSPPSQTNLMRETGGIVVTATELRIRIRFFSSRFAVLVEDAADRIRADSDDPSVRHAALEWKTKVIPHSQTTCFLADPMAALFDTWALAVQQRQYFQRESAQRRFGDQTAVALAAAEEIVAEVEELARTIQQDGDIAGSQTFVEEWAAAQTLDGDWPRRGSIIPELAEALAASDIGLSATFGGLGEDFADFSHRLSIINEFAPRQARWQAELLAYELGLHELEHWTTETVAHSTLLAERAVEVVEELPELLRSEREILLERATQERELLLEQVTREREAAQEFIDLTRLATLADVGRERELLTASLHEEVTRVLEIVTVERMALLAESERILKAQWPVVRDDLPDVAERSMDRTLEPLEALVDHGVLRLAQLGAAGLVGLLVVGLVLVRASRR